MVLKRYGEENKVFSFCSSAFMSRDAQEHVEPPSLQGSIFLAAKKRLRLLDALLP